MRCARTLIKVQAAKMSPPRCLQGELNNAAAKKFDLEAWFPTLAVYRELVSASNCTDYQSRSMEVRCGAKKADGPKRYCHFLNSTLCATERTICCILENYQVSTDFTGCLLIAATVGVSYYVQTPEGVRVPDVLVPFMGGRTFLPFVREMPASVVAAKKAKEGEVKVAEKASGGASTSTAAPEAAKVPVATSAPLASKPAVKTVDGPKAGPALSADVLGIVGKPVLNSAQGIASLNGALAIRSYVAGYSASAEDDVVFNALSSAGISEASALLKSAPHAIRWYKHIKSFPASERSAWPLTQAQLFSGALQARATTLFTL
jgi:hypothetical protein